MIFKYWKKYENCYKYNWFSRLTTIFPHHHTLIIIIKYLLSPWLIILSSIVFLINLLVHFHQKLK